MGKETGFVESENVDGVGGGREEETTSNDWKFSYEVLSGVNLLRLFLCNRKIPVPSPSDSLKAFLSTSLSSSLPVVNCEWKVAGGGCYIISLPMPLCLVDHSVPFRAVAGVDYIEVRIKLLPQTREFLENSILIPARRREHESGDCAVMIESEDNWRSTLSLATDSEMLSGKQGVSFYCKYCSAKVTSQVIRRFQALPSFHWRDFAENWFGGCCGHNAAGTWSKVYQFEEQLTPTPGTCLVGTTTCVLHCDDLLRGASGGCQQTRMDDSPHRDESDYQISSEFTALRCEPKNEISASGGETESRSGTESREDSLQNQRDQSSAILGNGVGRSTGRLKDSKLPAATFLASESQAPSTEGSKDSNLATTSAREASTDGGCCAAHAAPGHSNEGTSLPVAVTARAPANGFMSVSSNCTSFWTPFNCRNCSRSIGATSGESADGIQLFKCRISSDSRPGGPLDVFRNHSLERVFTNEIFAGAEDNTSYRYIIRDLNTKLPLMHLILVNTDSWACSGSCRGELRLPFEGDTMCHKQTVLDLEQSDGLVSGQDRELKGKLESDGFTAVSFEPCVQVMYRCTPTSASTQHSDAEDWTHDAQAETTYMFPAEVQALLDALLVKEDRFPASCQGFQSYNVSFLSR